MKAYPAPLRVWAESVLRDAAYGARNLRRQPGFAITAVATLALGIGLNTSLFTFFNSFALRPWPVRDPDRVVTVFEMSKARRRAEGFSLPLIRHFQENARSFSGLFAIRGAGVRAGGEQAGKLSLCQLVSGNYYRVLGIDMALGRGFLPEEDRIEAPQSLVVLSHSTWQARFGADRGIVGRIIRLNDVPFTVVGVSAPEFGGTSPEPIDFTIPLAALRLLWPQDASIGDVLNSPESCCSLAGRLGPGVSRAQARAELEVLARAFRGQSDPAVILVAGTSFLSHPDAKRELQGVFVLMLGGVLLILLLACANVGNLLLARAAVRQREIAIRLSVGATRGRLVRQLLTEGLVLAGIAGAAAFAIAAFLPAYVFRLALGAAPFRIAPDFTVVAYALAVSVLACAAFALAPALHGTARIKPRLRLRGLLLGTQVTISVVLLISAGLLTRSVRAAQLLDPGFAYKQVVFGAVELPANAYDSARLRAFTADLANQGFALASIQPFGAGKSTSAFRIGDKFRTAVLVGVTPAYFDVLKLPIVAGRNLTLTDRNAIVVNETMARMCPLGSTIFLAGRRESAAGGQILTREQAVKLLTFRDAREVVGFVKDAHTADLDRIAPTLYQPLEGVAPYVLLHDEPGAAERLQAALAGLDARAHVRLQPLSHSLARYLQPARVGASIALALGLLALAVASVGMFGVFAYVVEQRMREIGTRTVLGARPGQVVSLVAVTNARSMMYGLVVGLLVSAATSAMLRSYLYGIGPLDPATWAAVIVVVVVATAVASVLPAARAVRADPIATLRSE